MSPCDQGRVGHQARRERAVQGELRDVHQDLLGVREHMEAFQAMTREVNHVGDLAVRQHPAPRNPLVRLRWRRWG
jgi:hypothetical protein